ncbi:DUF5017 domain-containing protein [Pedobacter immunditicola]|uniref:DUF5017 domain-containing protein n=1 Tax=Pedobacter immunditicola TaxID=3133440 RepID=UPI003095EDE2
MKILRFILIINAAILLCACNKEIGLTPGFEEFDVTVKSGTYKVGDTVKFNIDGNPDLITFYSGELYKEYAFREERKINLNDAIFSFSTANPPNNPAQTDQFSVLYSTDFNGDYNNFKSVSSAKWTDITSSFKLGTTTTVVASGNLKMSDFVVPGKPLYVAFKYITHPISATAKPRPWYISNVTMLGNSVYGTHLLGDMVTAEFRLIEKNPELPNLSLMSKTRLTLDGYSYIDINDPNPGTETWIVSKAFNFEELDNGRDKPLAIKGNQDPQVDFYGYVYQNPGTYKVTFVASNVNVDGSKRKVVELDIKVE